MSEMVSVGCTDSVYDRGGFVDLNTIWIASASNSSDHSSQGMENSPEEVVESCLRLGGSGKANYKHYRSLLVKCKYELSGRTGRTGILLRLLSGET
jgi:hypothetical protein